MLEVIWKVRRGERGKREVRKRKAEEGGEERRGRRTYEELEQTIIRPGLIVRYEQGVCEVERC